MPPIHLCRVVMAAVPAVSAMRAALLLPIPRTVTCGPMSPAIPRRAVSLISATALIIAPVIRISCRLLVVAAFMPSIVALATAAIASRTRVRTASIRHDWWAAVHGRHCARALGERLFHLYDFVHDGMLSLREYIIHGLICSKTHKSKTTLSASVFINNDRGFHNGAVLTKIFLQFSIVHAWRQTAHKNLGRPLAWVRTL
mmetsp:Transcript_43113/g.90236  ORF Transcript_43113/g.90236 Transcript_43113/m.90236 type:complete len:200 (-) Transcript_43113:539-1138(-)